MKKALLLSFALMLVAGAAFAQLGSVGIFADPAGLSCNLLDQAPSGVKLYYVVHVLGNGVAGSQYRAKLPTCMTGTGAMFLADANMFSVVIGNSQNGVAVAYGACKVGAVHVQSIQVFAMGLTPPCCRWVVDGDPSAAPTVLVSDCNFLVWPATGGQGIINPNSGCQCNVPAEDTTWGQVKALYE